MARVAYGEGRDLLISATVDVVAEKGLRGLTFRAIAERAGVNNSLIAHHFGTREALLAAALEWAVERSIETTDLLELASEKEFADTLLEAISVRPELQAFQYEMILEARRNELYRAPVIRLYTRYHEVVMESLRHYDVEGDADAIARATFAALDGIVLQYMAGVDQTDLRGALEQVWAGIRPRIATPVSKD
ncbi:TetR family transcriptional regulator [Microbacterium sp. HD4P20]|uniref:TetR/AcrR family transcriptional regulator n=1 Tax=Microbacterium sp. HD4P20 TaxID=2864874 RepID=UPI0020A50E60|nr:TetR family transcriptional regulator [Microbacterium sp. HD4P20]MCP2635527.1 TetR family transcriptional regulator [Microbacterium sp. HD4P20]